MIFILGSGEKWKSRGVAYGEWGVGNGKCCLILILIMANSVQLEISATTLLSMNSFVCRASGGGSVASGAAAQTGERGLAVEELPHIEADIDVFVPLKRHKQLR